jgi:hypothetical protein
MRLLLTMRRLMLALLLPVTAGTAVAQGVVVAPHAVYLDHLTRSGAIILYNPGAEPAEVSITAFYGYPVTDSTGRFSLRIPDSVTSAMPSAAGWIEAYPKRLTLAPLTKQTIRLLARPPQGLPDGEYWSRITISAKGGALPVTGADTTGIRIGLNLEVRSIIPLIYRKGRLATGLTVSGLNAERRNDSIAVRAHLERQGTAAYVGTARGQLVSTQGKTVASFEQPVAIYYDADPVFWLPVTGLAPGRYRLRLAVATERSDIMPEVLLRTPPVRDSLEVTWP